VGCFVNGEIGPGRGGASRVGTHGYSTVLGLLGDDHTPATARTATSATTTPAPNYEPTHPSAGGAEENDRRFEFKFVVPN
jgi:hypothetical protein